MAKFGIHTTNLKATINGTEYTWGGGYGCVISSYERGIKIGDLRSIGSLIFSVYSVERSGWLRRVCWIPVLEFDMNWIAEFKAVLFGFKQ